MMNLRMKFFTVVCGLNFFDMQASSESGFARGFLLSSPVKKAPAARLITVIDDACEYSVIDGDGQEEVVQAEQIDPLVLNLGYHLLYEDGVKSLKKQNSELYSSLLGVEIERNTLLEIRKRLREEAKNYRYNAYELEQALQVTQKQYDEKAQLCLELRRELAAKQATIVKYDKELDFYTTRAKKHDFEMNTLKAQHEKLQNKYKSGVIVASGLVMVIIAMNFAHKYAEQNRDEGNVGY